MMQTDGALKQDCGDLTLTLEKRCHFRYEIENYFSCSHLARRDCDYHMIILVFRDENEITYCCSHVSRLMKIISRGQARKNETDSRREFPGSRILADLWPDQINEFIELIQSAGQRIWSWGVVTIFGKTPNMYLYITQNVSPNVSLNLPIHQICHEVCPPIHHQIW